ncbi:MAG TPA: RHS repeat-associated core domain-containing protein [Candidatus Acidoferrum sp.]|nr:RHS repeat-associated core domain-containing protein [Candidatus Acidoferrum sp.]
MLNFNGTSSTSDAFATLDSMGRKHVSQIRETPSGSNFDSTETDFDTFGRVSRVTLPYVATAGQTNASAPAITTTYDALNRTLKISDASTGYRTYSYSQNDVYVTRGPAPTGENTKRRQEEFDAFGRLTSVCEITSATGSGTCAQNSSQTGFWTKYSYNPLGKLTSVTQNAQSGSTQTRTYVYDLLGRVTSETNPENGTTTYVYDTDATCGTSSGDLVKKTDAVGNVTCISYDALHRPIKDSYPSGSYAANTPTKNFVYDSATVNGVAMSNAKGRLAEAYTCTGTCSTKITDVGFSYTVRGEPSDVYQSTPHSSGYYHVSAQYWANSALKQVSGIPGLPTMTYTPDGEGRPYQVSASSGQNPVTNTAFNAASLVTSVTYGSGDSDSFTYDSNTNRLTQYKFTMGSTPQSLVGNLTWNPNHTLASQNITDPFDAADQQNCSYTHDDLSRLASVNCGASTWQQNFSYDAFGNITKTVPTGGTGNSFQPTYSSSTNRFSSIPGCSSLSYDSNGNVLNDCNHVYTWDSAGKSVTVDSVNLTYDALGRMVEQNRSGTYTQIIYGPGGAKLALMNGQTLSKAFIGLPGGGQAVYNSSGILYYGHSDHLGSAKLGSTTSRTVSFAMAYAPFGETYATTGSTDPAFTGQRQDTVPGIFDFPARQYSTQGRWPAPDPSGLASVSLSDPQTLNRYAYVRNNPLTMIDPNGLCGAEGADGVGGTDDAPCSDSNGNGNSAGSGGSGGGPDPTSGGSQQNAGSDCGFGNLCVDSTGAQWSTQDQNDYMTEVTASISQDAPDVQTQDAPTGTILEQECGGCILSQLQNNSDAMATIRGTDDVVQALGWTEVAATTVVTGFAIAPTVIGGAQALDATATSAGQAVGAVIETYGPGIAFVGDFVRGFVKGQSNAFEPITPGAMLGLTLRDITDTLGLTKR